MSRRDLFRLTGALGLASAISAAKAATGLLRVAVLDFDTSKLANAKNVNPALGGMIAELLLAELSRHGRFTVIDRNLTRKVIDEQNFANSDRADMNAAVNIGKLLAAQAFVSGSVEEFAVEPRVGKLKASWREKIANQVGGIAGDMINVAASQVERITENAIIQVNYRLVSVETREVIHAGNTNGEGSKSRTRLPGSAGGAANGSAATEALRLAVGRMGTALSLAADSARFNLAAPPTTAKTSGFVLYVNGPTLVINLGSRDGMLPGSKLFVRRSTGAVRNADGNVAFQAMQTLGSMTIREAQEQGSAGVFSGSEAPKVNDIVEVDPNNR